MLDALADRLFVRFNQAGKSPFGSPASFSRSPLSANAGATPSPQIRPDRVEFVDEASISRSSSLSTLPASSASSDLEDDLADDRMQFAHSYDSISDRRGDRIDYESEDKLVVNSPVMQKIDAKWV